MPHVKGPPRRPSYPRDRAIPAGQESFAPIELDPKVSKHLRRVEYEGDSPLKGRLHEIQGWDKWTMERRIAFLRSFVEDTARDPAIAEKATQIVREAGVKLRDHQGEWAALLKWVQQNIRFTAEPKERIQSPQYTLTKRYGDCFPEDTPVLLDDHRLVPIKTLVPGQRIWGLNRWSVVEAVQDKGELPVTAIRLNNGSTVTLTEDHHVYVMSCAVHGPLCTDLTGSTVNCRDRGREFTEIRIRVSDLAEGMVMPSPDRIPFGQESMDPRRAYVEGLFLSDGWVDLSSYTRADGTHSEPTRFCISGKDGHPKEHQKREVQRICEELGIQTTWHARYITVLDAAWAKRLSFLGKRAFNKYAATINLDEAAAAELLRGIMADSGANTNGPSRTFTTTSPYLAIQTRVLFKMFGRTCGQAYIVDHGGLGEHPIWRLNPRVPTSERSVGTEKRLKVKKITRNVATMRCVDIQTDDHRVYLPASDVTVSQCDDLGITLAALGYSLRLPFKFVLSGKHANGKRVRWVEGSGRVPPGVNWTHIYVQAQWPPFRPTTFAWAEPTLDVPLGVDATTASTRGRADLGEPSEGGSLKKLVKELPWMTIGGSVVGSVISAVVVGLLVRPAIEARRPLRSARRLS